jgi:LmbE family N-acetylglucosaminyl deacetylase
MIAATDPDTDRACGALVVVAHPDDETLGAASLLFRRWQCRLIHVTDGAPRDPQFRPEAARSREQYARTRRSELTHALAVAGIEADSVTSLGVPDMEAVARLDHIAVRLATEIATLRPDVVVTHDYAGGHPDHDAVAWAVAAACRLLVRRGQQPPAVYEVPLYHGESGGFRVGEFLACGGGPEPVVVTLSAAERRRKRAMLDLFVSQRETLRPFYALEVERFRRTSLQLDEFARPPHDGMLLYERRGFPISGASWRSLAAAAARRLETHERCHD